MIPRFSVLFFAALTLHSAFGQLVTVPEIELPAAEWGRIVGASNVQLNGTNLKRAVVFSVPRTGTITSIGFTVTTVTTCSGCVVRVSLQTVNSNGEPTGTYYGSSNYSEQTGVTSGGVYVKTLGSPAAASAGDIAAAVFEWGAVQGDIRIAVHSPSGTRDHYGLPYSTVYTTSWTALGSRPYAFPIASIKYSTGWVYYTQAPPSTYASNVTIASSGGTYTDFGAKFKLPYTVRISGIWVGTSGVAGAQMTCSLYNGERTSTIATLISGMNLAYRALTNYGPNYYYFSPQILTANTWYNIGCAGDNTTTFSTYIQNLGAGGLEELRDANDLGQNYYWIHRTGGTWTELKYRRPAIGLLVTGIGIGTGGFATSN